MKVTAYNKKQLETCFKQMEVDFSHLGSLNVEWEKPSKAKTIKQLGFFWSALIDSISLYLKDMGYDDVTKDDIKWLMYSKASKKTNILGTMEKRFLTISDMNRAEMADFIDSCISVMDNDEMFDGLILHPSIRYCWVHNLGDDDIRNIDWKSLKRDDREYLAHTRKNSCLVCGKSHGIEAHHLKEEDDSGMAYKADDWECVPLCKEHHDMYHQLGKDQFENDLSWIIKYMPLKTFCAVKYLRWLNKI